MRTMLKRSVRARGLATLPTLQRKAVDFASKPVKSVAADAPISAALSEMSSGGFGAMLVSDGGQPQGILTERDFLLKTPKDGDLTGAKVGDMMTPAAKLTYASPDMPLDECLATMLRGGFRHLPVGSSSGVDAMLSMRDILRAAVSDGVPLSPLTVGDIFVENQRAGHAALDGMLEKKIGALTYGVVEVPLKSPVSIAVELMRERKVGSVVAPTMGPTIAESAGAFGIFTERDYVKALAGGSAGGSFDAQTTPIEERMTSSSKLLWVEPSCGMMAAIALMAEKGIRHLPVRKSQTWLHRPGFGVRGPEPTTLFSVLSMRELCSHLLPQ